MATTAGSPLPTDVALSATDGTPLKGWFWERPAPRAGLILSHGLGEHAGCYRQVAETLGPALGIDVLAFDYRGHGRSPGRRGRVRLYDDLTTDLRGALMWYQRQRPGLPRFVLAHSNGGLVALRTILGGAVDLSGLILSSPALRLAVAVPPLKRWIGGVLRHVAPGVTINTALPVEMLTRDHEHLEERRNDPLRHSRISAPLFFGMVEGGPSVVARAAEIRMPVLLILGAADPVTDPQTSKEFFERLGSPDKTLQVYPEMLHEPLNELDSALVLGDLAAWLSARLGPLVPPEGRPGTGS
jgi:alpha-beta hydrolase superfamily lysophospholipase